MIRTQFAPRPSLARKPPVQKAAAPVKPVQKPVQKPVHTPVQKPVPVAPKKVKPEVQPAEVPEIVFKKDAVAPFSAAVKWWQEPEVEPGIVHEPVAVQPVVPVLPVKPVKPVPIVVEPTPMAKFISILQKSKTEPEKVENVPKLIQTFKKLKH